MGRRLVWDGPFMITEPSAFAWGDIPATAARLQEGIWFLYVRASALDIETECGAVEGLQHLVDP